MAPGGRGRIAATVFLPEPMPAAPTVMFALPGGGYSRGYFDLHFPGHDGYSQAEHHVARGAVFVAMDHLGVGGEQHRDHVGARDDLLARPCRCERASWRRIRAARLGRPARRCG